MISKLLYNISLLLKYHILYINDIYYILSLIYYITLLLEIEDSIILTKWHTS